VTARERRNQSGKMLRVLLADSSAGVLIAEPDGTIRRANETLRQMLASGVALGAGADMGGIFAAAGRAGTRQALLEILASETPRTISGRLQTGTDDPYHGVAITALPFPGEAGQPARLVLRIVDTTAQRRMAAQLAHGQKLQALGQLAGGIAHDFNNLLTAVLAAAEQIRARDGVDAATAEDAAQIVRAGERGAALVRKLLAFGRQQTLLPRVIAINAAIRDMASMLRPMLGGTIELRLDLDTDEPLARVDPTQLDQVLLNLAMNARQAMPAGGQLILHSGHVVLYRPLARGAETIPPGSYVMVEVRDNGCGIPPQLLAHIFEPFFTTRRGNGGTGLGLATVHGIVRQSHGFLTVDSTVGQGTSMRIYLPRHAGPVDQVAISAAAAPPPARSVLLVDDEAMLRDLMARALRQAGWTVLTADSAESAMETAESGTAGSLAAVISDVVMPGQDGPALVRALRARWPRLPAILVSGYAEERLRVAMDGEGIHFLPKPYGAKDLLALLARITGTGTGTASHAVRPEA
jgi:two-component system cell cycle sensor histidine kinase/response regulator CckA